uniref:Uncharacterized protein n=1 Tax=Salix viminalis TaxID=40686 RepID=A0A6N2MSP6_SALVM
MSRQLSPPVRGFPPPSPPIDHEKTCPLLLRFLAKVGEHRGKEDFSARQEAERRGSNLYMEECYS